MTENVRTAPHHRPRPGKTTKGAEAVPTQDQLRFRAHLGLATPRPVMIRISRTLTAPPMSSNRFAATIFFQGRVDETTHDGNLPGDGKPLEGSVQHRHALTRIDRCRAPRHRVFISGRRNDLLFSRARTAAARHPGCHRRSPWHPPLSGYAAARSAVSGRPCSGP